MLIYIKKIVEVFLVLCIMCQWFADVGLVAAKKAKSPADIADSLQNDLKGSSVGELQAFAREMFVKVERRTSGANVSFI